MNKSIRLLQVMSILAMVTYGGDRLNFIRETTYASDPEDAHQVNPPKVVTTHADGLGRERQVVETINNPRQNDGYGVLVTGTEYNDAGRPVINYNAAGVKKNEGYVEDLKEVVRNYYEGMGYGEQPYAYSETRFYLSPSGRVAAAGFPGEKHAIHYNNLDPEKERFPRTWYLRTKIGIANHPDFTEDGFVKAPEPGTKIEHYLDALQNPSDSRNFTDPTHYLTVYRSARGFYTQEITDKYGRLVRTAASAAERLGSSIVAIYKYDIQGNVLEEAAPKDDGAVLTGNTVYKYNSLGQLVWKETPDAGSVEYTYNDAGLLVKYVDANLRVEGPAYSIRYEYDVYGRRVCTYKYKDAQEAAERKIQPKIVNVYDYPENAGRYFGGSVPDLLKNRKRTRGRLVGTIAFTEDAGWYTEGENYDFSNDSMVIDAMSYDTYGRVETAATHVPGLDDQSVGYRYDLQGKITLVEYKKLIPLQNPNGGTDKVNIQKVYRYDSEARLAKIRINHFHGDMVHYSYLPTHLLKEKTLYRNARHVKEGIKSAGSMENDYTIRGWLRYSAARRLDKSARLETERLFDHEGNVLGITDRWLTDDEESVPGTIDDYSYTYDKINRLVSAKIKKDGATHQATFAYDNAGRITEKHEEWQDNNWGPYTYESGNSRLQSIGNSNRASKDGKRNYVHDPNGNIIVDRSKNVTIEYDYRNLPIRFNFHRNLDHVSDDVAPPDIPALRGNVVSYVKMVYNANGQRVMKQEFRE